VLSPDSSSCYLSSSLYNRIPSALLSCFVLSIFRRRPVRVRNWRLILRIDSFLPWLDPFFFLSSAFFFFFFFFFFLSSSRELFV